MSASVLRKDAYQMPSIDLDQKLLELLDLPGSEDFIKEMPQDDPDSELNEQVLSEIVNPMLHLMRRLIRENPEQAKRGLRVTINIKSHDTRDSEFFTTQEVAQMYRMSQQQIRRWCESGKIRAIRAPGGSWRIDASQFDGVGVLAPKGRKKRRDIDSLGGAWKGNDDALRELREERE